MKFVRFIWHNVLRNKRRTFLTMVSMAFMLFLFCGLIAVMVLMDTLLKRAGTLPILAVHRRTAIMDPMPEAYRAKIEGVPGVAQVCPMQWYGGIGKDPEYFFQSLGCDASNVSEVMSDMIVTTPEENEAFRRERTGVIMGNLTARKLGVTKGDEVILKGTVYPVDLKFKVMGVFPPEGDPSIFLFHREYLDEAIGRLGIVNLFWVKVERPDLMESVARHIDEMFENSPAETLTESRSALFTRFLSMQGNVRAIVNVVTMLVLISLLLVVANSMAMSMRERTMEIAVLKALGFLRGRILTLLLSEAVFIATVGGSLGCLASYWLLNQRGFTAGFGPLSNVRVTTTVLLEGISVSALMGLASGWIPAWRATNVPLIEALRKVG